MSENPNIDEIMQGVNKTGTDAPELSKENPSVERQSRVTSDTRIPMSTRTLRMEVPEIPGYYLHWATQRRVPRMLRAGYEFVNFDEVDLTNLDVSGDRGMSGNSDMGSRVSIAAGVQEDSGRLVLLKIRQEWRNADLKKIEEENEKIAASIRGGNIGDNSPDHQRHRYLKEGQELFIPRDKRRFK